MPAAGGGGVPSAPLRSFSGHSNRVWSLSFSAMRPSVFASGSDDCSLRLWDVKQHQHAWTADLGANVCGVAFSPWDEHTVACGTAAHSISIYDVRNNKTPLSSVQGAPRPPPSTNPVHVPCSCQNRDESVRFSAGRCLKGFGKPRAGRWKSLYVIHECADASVRPLHVLTITFIASVEYERLHALPQSRSTAAAMPRSSASAAPPSWGMLHERCSREEWRGA